MGRREVLDFLKTAKHEKLNYLNDTTKVRNQKEISEIVLNY